MKRQNVLYLVMGFAILFLLGSLALTFYDAKQTCNAFDGITKNFYSTCEKDNYNYKIILVSPWAIYPTHIVVLPRVDYCECKTLSCDECKEIK